MGARPRRRRGSTPRLFPSRFARKAMIPFPYGQTAVGQIPGDREYRMKNPSGNAREKGREVREVQALTELPVSPAIPSGRGDGLTVCISNT